jgi:predicted glycoside hydrolase/deacetylase ChbG (UPF0249 family)
MTMTTTMLQRVRRALLMTAVAVTTGPVLAAQTPADHPSLAERLGYAADAKLLIIHGDDLGMAHSVNRGTLDGMRNGVVNSGSVMVPTPWFPEIAAAAREDPDLDLGLHLTLTAEWRHYRWGPVLPVTEVPTLVDSAGYLWATAEDAAAHMDPGEAEAELRAQVERAMRFGMRPTHLDSHMGTLFETPELFEAYLQVGRDYALPVLIPADAMAEQAAELTALVGPDDIVIDRLLMIYPGVAIEDWEAFYLGLIEDLEPGVTEIIVHVAYDDDEIRAATAGNEGWDAPWRQADLDAVTGPALRRALDEHGVQLITWREIGTLLRE